MIPHKNEQLSHKPGHISDIMTQTLAEIRINDKQQTYVWPTWL